jgi:hypothetical protein
VCACAKAYATKRCPLKELPVSPLSKMVMVVVVVVMVVMVMVMVIEIEIVMVMVMVMVMVIVLSIRRVSFRPCSKSERVVRLRYFVRIS